ncbi:MAG TPA: hypothetical protein VFX61_12730 [Micromonosporaceae bacterium]|nr:hypothetical protein [Micromonosporaceae bacterium]
MRTPAGLTDLGTLMPELTTYRRTATRLHPRRGMVDADASHIGGPIRWPEDETWPMCAADLAGEDEQIVPQLDGGYLAVRRPPAIGARPLPHPQPNPMIVLAQLRARDVPDLWCPLDHDVLQVLWCPCDHEQEHANTPTVRLRWRRHDPAVPVATPLAGIADERFYVPIPCVFYPEQIDEYPDLEDLPDALVTRIAALGEEIDYSGELSTAPGWKVGGWPQWSVSGHRTHRCDTCGAAMSLLLTIDTVEHGGNRWEPVEERRLPLDESRSEPTGIVVGRWGSLQIFVCTRCPDHPTRPDLQ